MRGSLFFRFSSVFLGLLLLFRGLSVHGQTVTWTGAAGTESWNDPANWSGAVVPGLTALVLLDNRSVPGSYRVRLPDLPVSVESIAIRPLAGKTIELLLPASNVSNAALVLTGSGYPLTLANGAVFRNECGISSGPSVELADSFLIENGGRYIHSTRGTHAASLLAKLSTSPGTERGIFEFDVPRASYTISVSNRIYGTLALRATAFAAPVNYTCSGSNPLLVRGDLDIGTSVSLSADLAGPRGTITVDGDLRQGQGSFTLGSGAGDSTLLALNGNFIQQPGAELTSAADAYPRFEFTGPIPQTLDAAGEISGHVAVAIKNPSGVTLAHQLRLSFAFELLTGVLITSDDHLLTLADTCTLRADSLAPGTYVDGPLRRQIANGTLTALFPVGAGGAGRWLAVKESAGIFTARYVPENPASLGTGTGTGIDHISSNEYWYLTSTGPASAKVELSHAAPQSGSITEPSVLRVARLQEGNWMDAGESAFTGDLVQGSVISDPVTDFTGRYFTLGSALARENPLPLETVSFSVSRRNTEIAFDWKWDAPEAAAGFDIMQLENGSAIKVGHRQAEQGVQVYAWTMPAPAASVVTRWRIDLIDRLGRRHPGESVLLPALRGSRRTIFVAEQNAASPELHISSQRSGAFVLKCFSVSGLLLWCQPMFCQSGENRWPLPLPPGSRGIGIVQLRFEDGEEKTLRVRW